MNMKDKIRVQLLILKEPLRMSLK